MVSLAFAGKIDVKEREVALPETTLLSNSPPAEFSPKPLVILLLGWVSVSASYWRSAQVRGNVKEKNCSEPNCTQNRHNGGDAKSG